MRIALRGYLALVVAGLLGACASEDDSVGNTERVPSSPVAATEIQVRDLSRELRVSARVEPRTRIRLASRPAGTVQAVHYEEGDRVSAGDVLLELDMAEERAELARAEAQEEDARIRYRRAAELRERGVISPAEYDAARVSLLVAESNRRLWQSRVGFGQVTTPRDAVVTAKYVEPGDGVDAQMVLFELAAMDTLVLRPALSELDVVHLEAGQPVRVRLDALPELELDASVRRIFPAAEAVSRLVTVEIALPGDAFERGVRPGYLARALMTVDSRPEAIAVPSAAVGEDGDVRYVYVIEEDTLHRREVETGVTRARLTEIVDGLEAGEVVLATNPIDMRDGQRVRIVGWRD